MKRILSRDLSGQIGEEVRIEGWLHNVRELGKIAFLVVRDRGGLTQIVIEDKKELAKLKEIQPGSVLRVIGNVVETKTTDFGVEITKPKIEVLVPIIDVPPVSYNKKSLDVNIDTELDYRPLVIRNLKKQAIFKVQAGILEAFSNSMRRQDFTEFRSPVLMGVPSESGASVFEVNYFEGKAYLAQSPQIYKQIMLGAFERVFTVATVFRAEKHSTTRHLMEITQLDAEMGFIENYDEAMEVAENVIRDILENIKTNYQAELEITGTELPKLPDGRFPKIKVKDALEIIEKRTGKSAAREELDVDPEDEREVAKWALEEYGSDFYWLIGFKNNKNFYTWDDPDVPTESLSYDLECRGLELLSGTHRIHKYDELYKRFKKQGLKEEHYEHYLQAFKYGIPSEAGFSFGLERITQQIFGLKNIREATLFPSDLKRVAGANRIKEKLSGEDAILSKIRQILDTRDRKYEYDEHKAVTTSEDAAKLRGTKLSDGAKSLILVGKKSKKRIMVVIPADKRLDMKSIAAVAGEKFEFEKPEIMLSEYGLKLGGVPPFGNVLGLQVYMDEHVAKNSNTTFNAGKRTCSITMDGADLAEVTEAEIGEFSK